MWQYPLIRYDQQKHACHSILLYIFYVSISYIKIISTKKPCNLNFLYLFHATISIFYVEIGYTKIVSTKTVCQSIFFSILYIKIASTKICMSFNLLVYILCDNIPYQDTSRIIFMWKQPILRYYQQKHASYSINLSIFYVTIAYIKIV